LSGAVPLDAYFWIPWQGPVVRMYTTVLKELTEASKPLAFMTALAAVGHFIDAEIEGIGGNIAKTTLYVGVIGVPAAGKTTVPYHVFRNLARRGLKVKLVGARTSSEGLARVLAETGSVVHIADEVHQMFRGRRRESYVGEVLDLWKTAYYRVPITFARRSKKKTIDIPEDARLTVIWTTTYDDFETVTSVMDRALLRRFAIVTVDRVVDPWSEGDYLPMEWEKIAGELMFLNEFRWHVVLNIDDEVRNLRSWIATALKLGGESLQMLSEQSIRIATILALDRVVALTEKLAGLDRVDVYRTAPSTSQHLIEWFQQVAMQKNTDEFNSSISYHIVEGGVYTHRGREPGSSSTITPSLEKSEEYTSSKSVDIDISILSNICRRTIQLLVSKPSPEPVQASTYLIHAIKNTYLPVPTVEIERGNEVGVYIPSHYMVLALSIAVLPILASGFVRRWIGVDERWAYFLRRLEEMRRRGMDVVKMRDLARYMKKFRGYRELLDYVKWAVAAGILVIESEGPVDDITSARFRINTAAFGWDIGEGA